MNKKVYLIKLNILERMVHKWHGKILRTFMSVKVKFLNYFPTKESIVARWHPLMETRLTQSFSFQHTNKMNEKLEHKHKNKDVNEI